MFSLNLQIFVFIRGKCLRIVNNSKSLELLVYMFMKLYSNPADPEIRMTSFLFNLYDLSTTDIIFGKIIYLKFLQWVVKLL